MAATATDALGSAQTGATVGFWINPSARAAGYAPVTPGRVLTVGIEAEPDDEYISVEAAGATELRIGGASLAAATVAIPTNGLDACGSRLCG